ncbi:MAG TPA: hypothetical protein VLC48_03645 [Gemmatimonadota bacterium]|nr:hypothetical protein [Gemmatimonadota bacterium]
MYRTCIFCNHDLGSNETVENFPVGHRLAFDQDKGRLWVICERCRRWNLSPLEERWEAIEECERRYHDTRNRFSTDNIGMAMLAEGTQLVRIGRPKRREFAAWRYGRQFWRRRVASTIATSVQVVVGVGGAILGANLLPLIFGLRQNRVVARVRDDDNNRLILTPGEVGNVRLFTTGADGDWSLEVPYKPRERVILFIRQGAGKRQTAVLSGPTALRAAARILPRVNEYGGNEEQVRHAVSLIEENPSAERLFARLARPRGTIERTKFLEFESDATLLKKVDREALLALEMASHEDSERRALEGELEILEAAWREAEEIASIADRLLIPERVENLLNKFRREVRRGQRPETALADLEAHESATD